MTTNQIFIQSLYEAVFALSDICCPFSVYTRVGHIPVDPDCVSLAELIQLLVLP